ncbi:hypothetical protein [Butyricimonas faecihominis]
MDKFEMNCDSGFYTSNGNVVTFEVQGAISRDGMANSEYHNLYARYLNENRTMQLQGFTVPIWGEGHNLYPQEVYNTVSDNKLLPEILQKQVEFLFGRGPYLYTTITEGEGKNKKQVRVPVEDEKIMSWLESWEANGYGHFWDYLINLIEDFYHTNCCITQYHFNVSRRVSGSIPVRALSYQCSDRARFATNKQIPVNRQLSDADCQYVILGDWMAPASEFEIYHRFDPANPFANPTAISWVKDKTFGKSIYPFCRWFKGLQEWIKGSNLTPRYINSYLRNALNAHVHVIIPGSWYQHEKGVLENICRDNMINGTARSTYYKGVKLTDESGNPVEFHEGMMEQLINYQLRQITKFLSGEGENQGKLWASTKWGEDGWEFKDFPGSFKEYMEAVISYDKRADQVILAGKGINASITNVENDGVLSKSGSDVYYNYLIYANALVIAEFYVTQDINRAIRYNFPYAVKENIRLGFRIDIPSKQQETTPADRQENVVGK